MRGNRLLTGLGALAVWLGAACGPGGTGGTGGTGAAGRGTLQIVVTYPILGAMVRDVVGDSAEVTVLMPNGADPHDWSPSAKDVARLFVADVVVANGLDLETNLVEPLRQVAAAGVTVFSVAEHVTVRTVGEGESVGTNDPDQAAGAKDPHLWMDPLTMREWIAPFADVLASKGADVATTASSAAAGLGSLDEEVRTVLDVVPPGKRRLVTGHESMGYFAARYGFQIVGAAVPALSPQAEASAGDLARLAAAVTAADVPAVFAELGTSSATIEALAADTGTRVVELSTHTLPAGGTYRDFMLGIAHAVASGLG